MKELKKEVRKRMAVSYYDEHGKAHDALVTEVHGPADQSPSVNLLYVADDERKTDQYGQQIERQSSVVHGDDQSAHGNYWTFLS